MRATAEQTEVASRGIDYRASLNQAQTLMNDGKPKEALSPVIDVLSKTSDQKLLADARTLFEAISPQTATIYLKTIPAGATIFINNIQLNAPSPVITHKLQAGRYTIRFVHPEFKPKSITMDLVPKEFASYTATLQK